MPGGTRRFWLGSNAVCASQPRSPRRQLMVTTMILPFATMALGSYRAPVPEVSEPPWIQMKTGRVDPGVADAGMKTFKKRQSSD